MEKRQSSPSSQGREFLLCLTGPGPAQGLPARSTRWDAREEGESRVFSTLGSRRALLCSTSCQQRSSPADGTQVLPFPAHGPRLRPSLVHRAPLCKHRAQALWALVTTSPTSAPWVVSSPLCGVEAFLAAPLLPAWAPPPELPAVGSLVSMARSIAQSALAQP